MQLEINGLQQPSRTFKKQANTNPPRPEGPTRDNYYGLERPYMEYLTCKKIFTHTLPPEVKREVERSHIYFVFINGTLQWIRKGGNNNQVCIPEAQVPGYLAKIHGESQPHLAAIETWKAVAIKAYWWPTWGHDVCNNLRYCRTCKRNGNPGEPSRGLSKFLSMRNNTWTRLETPNFTTTKEHQKAGPYWHTWTFGITQPRH